MSQWLKYLLNFIGIIVISRILGPGEVGLVSMTIIVVGLANLFSDFGLSLAAIQVKNLGNTQRDGLYWLNVAVGATAAAVVCVISPLVAEFYEDSRVGPLLTFMSVSLVLTSLGIQFRVGLTRSLKFKGLAVIDVAASITALGVAISLALLDFGYWALAWQGVTLAGVTTFLLILTDPWLPRWPGRVNLSSFVRFGANNLATQAMNFLATNSPAAALGRLVNPTSVGLFTRSAQLTVMPIQQIVSPLTRVMLPRLSRATTTTEFGSLLVSLQRIISYSVLMILVTIACTAHSLVSALLGTEWLPAVRQIQILSIATAFQALSYLTYWAFLARAKTGWLFLAELPGRVLLILGVWFVAPYGPSAIALLVLAQNIVIWAVGALIMKRKLGVDVLELFATSARPLVLAILAATAGSVPIWLGINTGPWGNLALQLLFISVAIAGLFALSKKFRNDLKLIRNTIR